MSGSVDFPKLLFGNRAIDYSAILPTKGAEEGGGSIPPVHIGKFWSSFASILLPRVAFNEISLAGKELWSEGSFPRRRPWLPAQQTADFLVSFEDFRELAKLISITAMKEGFDFFVSVETCLDLQE